MKKILSIISFLVTSFISHPQISYTDSLLNVIRNSKTVRQRIEAARLFNTIYAFNIDSVGYSAEQILKISEETNYKDIQAFGYCAMAWYLKQTGERFKALQKNIEALKLAEEVGDSLLLANIYLRFAAIYPDNQKDISASKIAINYLEGITSLSAEQIRSSALHSIGVDYSGEKKYDSALLFLKKAEEEKMQMKDSANLSVLYNAFANVYFNLNNPQMALAYLEMAVKQADREGAFLSKANSYGRFAIYYRSIRKYDSALNYLERIYAKRDMNKLPPAWVAEPSLIYYDVYRAMGNDKQALKYIDLYRKTKPKADSLLQAQKAQDLAFEEEVRQQQIEEEKLKQKEDRKHNLQFAAIAFGLITFSVLFLLFSHSVIASQKVIRSLGVVALLMVFEFINLFIHPYLSRATNDSPLLMLLGMVFIAALLVPIHHRMEHWITHKLVEKNNKIRLAAAKKTIAKLEGEHNN